jgi:UDPglucose 6-dehydrogenase
MRSLPTKITFINEMAGPVREGGRRRACSVATRHRALTAVSARKFLHAGPGYGGSCFPKDTLALVRTAQDAGTPSRDRRGGG